MAFYQFKKEIIVNTDKESLWDFISSPKNLKKITPDYMGFDITSGDFEDMYQGMIISYKVSPLLGIKTTWVTEITHCEEGKYFVDEQRVGPYSMWHHQHIIEEIDSKSCKMIDIVSYSPPFSFLGSIANSLFIKSKLNEIFEYRENVFKTLFK